MTSVERILHYACLPPEEEALVQAPVLPEGWPAQGGVDFQELRVRYREALFLPWRAPPGRVLLLLSLTLGPEPGPNPKLALTSSWVAGPADGVAWLQLQRPRGKQGPAPTATYARALLWACTHPGPALRSGWWAARGLGRAPLCYPCIASTKWWGARCSP